MTKKIIRFLTAGSVDDGKSTLIGRLLYDTNSLYEDQIAEVKKLSDDQIDYSLFVEGLESERKQKITIDVAYRYFFYQNTKFIIADAPGHEQYTKNMAVAASNSNVAIILIDAADGIKTQTIRHSYIAHLFGIRNFIVAINKMDLVNYSQERFEQIRKEYLSKIQSLQLDNISFVPISAINGDNVAKNDNIISWYQGKSFLDSLESIDLRDIQKQGFRIVIQNVFKDNKKRFYQGKIIAGNIAIGDEILIYPSQKTAKIIDIIHSSNSVKQASNGDSITIILNKDIDIDRGSVFSAIKDKPNFDSQFKANLLWFGNQEFNLNNQKEILIKINHNLISTKINDINHLINIDDFSKYQTDNIQQNQIANIKLSFTKAVAFDFFNKNKYSGSFFLIDKQDNETLACGLICGLVNEKEYTKKTQISIFRKFLSYFKPPPFSN